MRFGHTVLTGHKDRGMDHKAKKRRAWDASHLQTLGFDKCMHSWTQGAPHTTSFDLVLCCA